MTTATLPQVPQSGGINGIAQLLQALGPMFGSGTTTSKESGADVTSSSSSPDSNNQADELIKKIFGDVNPADIDNMVGNILERAKQTFGAQNGVNSNAAGVRAYSDTVREQLQNEAMARATGEAAKAKLDALSTANKQASDLVQTKLQTNRTQVATKGTTTTKATGVSPVGKGVAGVGLAALGYNLLKKKGILGDKEAIPTDRSGDMDYGIDYSESPNAGDESFSAPSGSGDVGVDSAISSSASTMGVDDTAALQDLLDSTVIPTIGDNVQTASLTSDVGDAGLFTTSAVDTTNMSTILSSQGLTTGAAMPAATLPMGDGSQAFPMPPAPVDPVTGLPLDVSKVGLDETADAADVLPADFGGDLSSASNFGPDLFADEVGPAADFTADAASTAGLDFGLGLPPGSLTIADALTGGEISKTIQSIPIVGDIAGEVGEIGNEAIGAVGDVAGDVAETAGGLVEDAGDFVSSAADSVICSEAVRQGLLDKELYKAEGDKSHVLFSQRTFNGYHYWAKPIVARMREDSKYAKQMASWAKAYGEFLVHNKWSVKGLIARYVAVPIAFLTGLWLEKQPIIVRGV